MTPLLGGINSNRVEIYIPTAYYRMSFVVTEDKRDFFAKLRDAFKPRKPKTTRGFEDFEEDAQQDIISGLQGSLAARDLQPSFKPGPKSASKHKKTKNCLISSSGLFYFVQPSSRTFTLEFEIKFGIEMMRLGPLI